MYSLYRAWLSLGPPCTTLPSNIPSLISPTPLNLTLPSAGQVPDIPDVALQVGPNMTHFSAHKAVLSNHSGFFKAALANVTGLGPISVPNVNVDEFSSLLTFMYTGYLDLNVSNIYNILLATHILHMPRALDLCRSFLLQSQQNSHSEQRTNIIKPIPSRKIALPSQEIFPPVFGGFKKSADTVFKSVRQENYELSEASTSKVQDGRDNKQAKERKQLNKQKKRIAEAIICSGGQNNNNNKSNNEKVIIDIACCDGPVRFHRVINKNYGIQNTENYEISEINRNVAMNKVMNENILEKLNNNNKEENQSNEVFTCLYCNHTFKSQYCYQKHARRHLYPVNLERKIPQKEAKREVKLLDMNVQYYPCKTCGSKFPSYYFVHKHRKMCHAEEVADKNNKNNEIVAEGNAENTNGDSSCSAIDVEAVNTNTEHEIT